MVTTTAISRPASALAVQLDCENQRGGQMEPLELNEPLPIDIVDCSIGDAQLSILTYSSSDEVARVLAARTDRGCGIRTVGDYWIVVANTLETARLVQQRLGGRLVTFRGCP